MDIDRRDRHLNKRTTLRPNPEVKKAGLRALHAAGWTLNDFVQACLVLVTKNPKAMLDRLAEFRPPPRVGRPNRTPQQPGAEVGEQSHRTDTVVP